MRLSLPALFSVPVVACGFVACVQTTNHPNDFGKSIEQPPPKNIERTSQQWCLDYCAHVRTCFEQDEAHDIHKTPQQMFAECKKAHGECDVTQTAPAFCCTQIGECKAFDACIKDSEPNPQKC